MFSASIPSDIIYGMIKAASIAMSDDEDRPSLCCVSISVPETGLLRVEATDGARLHRLEWWNSSVTGSGKVLIAKSDVEQFLRSVKPNKKSAYRLAAIDCTADSAKIVCGSATHEYVALRETYPDTDAVLRSVSKTPKAVVWAVDPRYFADLKKVRKALGTDSGMLVTVSGELDPILVICDSHDVRFVGIIMPMRY